MIPSKEWLRLKFEMKYWKMPENTMHTQVETDADEVLEFVAVYNLPGT